MINTRTLDGLRFLLALWVAFGHFYIIIGGTKFLNIPIISGIIAHPVTAVDGFMIITGFLMAYNYFLRESKEPFDHPSTGKKFLMRRVFRLYPVYLVAIIAASLLVTDMYVYRKEALVFFTGSSLTMFGTESKMEAPTFLSILSHLFMIHGVVPKQDSTLLSVGWSLSLEMQFYVLFPLIFSFLFRKIKVTKLLIAAVLSVIAGLVSMKMYHAFYDMPALLICKLPLFLLGMFMAASGAGKLPWKYFFAAAVVILPFQEKLTMAVAVIILAAMCVQGVRKLLHPALVKGLVFMEGLLSGRIARLGADLSYSLYLMHLIILPFLLKLFIGFHLPKLQVAGFTFVSFIVVCFFVSYLLHVLIEKPFIEIGKKIVSRIGYNGTIQDQKDVA